MKVVVFILSFFFPLVSEAIDIPTSKRAEKAIASVKNKLIQELAEKGLNYGDPIFIRIFKASSELELWIKEGAQYKLFKTYEICRFSGSLGPKTKQGDKQAPEGFYFVKPRNLNPHSSFHLSFNLGYPNAYDRAQGYTGSALMVHGKCVSIGCYAMTDKNINEIYALAHAAFANGQAFFKVHVFPFRLDTDALENNKQHKWYRFWKNLQEGYELFEASKVPPNVVVRNGMYQFQPGD